MMNMPVGDASIGVGHPSSERTVVVVHGAQCMLSPHSKAEPDRRKDADETR
jgi:hypothetical protein